MRKKMTQFVGILMKDPAVASVVGFTGGGQTNSGFVFMELKPLAERKLTTDQVIARLRRELQPVTGAQLFLQSVQDIRVGGRQSNAQYQYTLQSDNLEDLHEWTPKLAEALRHVPELTDVDSDQQQGGLETEVTIDRQTAQRLGISTSQIDNTLYDAFGQRQVSTIYNPLNQYHVVMEVAPAFWQSPDTLKDLYVSTSGGAVSGVQATNAVAGTTTASTAAANTSAAAAAIASDAARNQATNSIASTGKGSASTGSAVTTKVETMVPLSAFAHFAPGSTPVAVNHQGLFAASTISFNLAPGIALSTGVAAINRTMTEIGVPGSIHGTFQGTAQVFQQSLASEPILIAAALIAVYIVLGILYESYIHPITILSTLPSAGIGAVLALLVTGVEFSHHLPHRRDPADRHRQEERHHDDRLRPRCGAPARPLLARCDLRGLPAPLPPDHDDDHGRAARRPAARHRPRPRRGAAPAAGHLHRRRADRQPAPDPLHHAGGLSLFRPPALLDRPPLAPPPSRRRGGRMSGTGRSWLVARPATVCPLAPRQGGEGRGEGAPVARGDRLRAVTMELAARELSSRRAAPPVPRPPFLPVCEPNDRWCIDFKAGSEPPMPALRSFDLTMPTALLIECDLNTIFKPFRSWLARHQHNLSLARHCL